MKICNCCGTKYARRPLHAKLHLEAIAPGYYYNCTCKSTLGWPLDDTQQEMLTKYAKLVRIFKGLIYLPPKEIKIKVRQAIFSLKI